MKKADRIAMMIHNTGDSVTEYRKGRERNFFVVRLGANTWGLEKSTSGCTCGVRYADTREEIEAYVAENGYKAVKTWTRPETKDEPQQVMPQPETPTAPQETANEPEAAQEQTEEAKARELHVRAEGLCEEGKLHENFVRSVQKVEFQAYKAMGHEHVVWLASKNPRVAAAMEHLRAKQTAPNDKPQACERKPAFEAGGVYRNEAQEAGKDTIKVTARSGCVVTFVWNGQEMTADVRFDDPSSEYILMGLKPFFASELETGEEPTAGQPAPQEAATPENKINALFHELVPVEGKADTAAGEIVRAVCRIGYRYSNDGDYVGHGYGKETCNPAARYLMANAGENVAEIVRRLWAAGEECGILDDGSYDDWLSELVKAALAYLDEHPELKTTPNAVGYWDYRDPNEDVDEWDDEDEDEWGAA